MYTPKSLVIVVVFLLIAITASVLWNERRVPSEQMHLQVLTGKNELGGAVDGAASAQHLTPSNAAEMEARVLRAASQLNQTGSFYGLIVDAKTGLPVANIDILAHADFFTEGGHPSLGLKTLELKSTSNDNGAFAFENVRGVSMTIVPVSNNSENVVPRNVSVDFRDRTGRYYFAAVSSREKPFVFRLPKMEVNPVKEGGAIAFYDFTPDGAPFAVHFSERRIDKGGSPDISIAFRRAPGEVGTKDVSWSVVLTAGNAAMKENSDPFESVAPHSGYVDRWEGNYTAGDKNYSREKRVNFFFRFKDGRFVRSEIRFISDYQKGSAVVMKYWVAASRDLR